MGLWQFAGAELAFGMQARIRIILFGFVCSSRAWMVMTWSLDLASSSSRFVNLGRATAGNGSRTFVVVSHRGKYSSFNNSRTAAYEGIYTVSLCVGTLVC
jgi:hypothetical protein